MGTSATSADTALFSLPNGGTTWQQIDVPGLAANASEPSNLAVSPSGIVYVANTANIVAWGYPTAGWTQLGAVDLTGSPFTSVAAQVVPSNGQAIAAGTIPTAGNWLMLLAALDT